MSSSAIRNLLVVFALSGCASPPPYVASGPFVRNDIPRTDSLLPGIQPSPSMAPAADPSLPGFDGWPLSFAVSIPRGTSFDCEVVVHRGSATLATLEGTIEGSTCTALWDGREAGQPARPGPLSIEANLIRPSDGAVRATAMQGVEVVRVGIDRIEVDAEPGRRIPLLFRQRGGRRGNYYELTASVPPFGMGPDSRDTGAASALELASGARREVPLPWNDVLTPPLDAASSDGIERDVFNLPSALIAGSLPTLVARLSTTAAEGVSGDPVDTEVRILAPTNTTISGQDRVGDGQLVTLEATSTPVPGVGRFDVAYTFGFEARQMGGAFVRMPGELTITLRYYGLVAAPTFFDNTLPHRTWVDVIDRIAEWVGGTTADPDAVGARLVEGIYYELGLRYDTRNGASFYTDYVGRFAFEGAVFDMDAFEERDNGSVVNCSDSASILSSYANMVGLDYRYHILRRGNAGFDLNYIQAIGGTMFDETPFDGGGSGFSYHAIVGARDGTTWDATLAVDGDGAPGSLPSTLLLVQGLDARAYLEALSSQASEISTTFDDHVRIR